MESAQVSFQRRFNVSRETIDRLTEYEQLVKKWNPVINLTAKSTITEIWTRHMADSAEIFEVANTNAGRWLDLGSGGGFPGLVVAIIAKEHAPDLAVTCIESDTRKCEFLRTVTRMTEISVGVLSTRIEDTPPHNADVLSARALAPLSGLLEMAERHLSQNGTAVFHKGRSWRNEVEDALESWRFKVEKYDNPTHPDSVILKIGDIARG